MKSFLSLTTSSNKRPLIVLIIFAMLLFLMKTMSIPGSAQSSSERGSFQSQNERLLEIKSSQDLPFRIKLKEEKEKSFKDLKNDKWLREFELELTNTGDK